TIGMAAFKPRTDQPLPDIRQLIHAGAEKVNPLASGDFGVKSIILCYLSNDDQFLRSDFSSGNSGHHGIRPSFLDIGKKSVIGILNGVFSDDKLVPGTGQ